MTPRVAAIAAAAFTAASPAFAGGLFKTEPAKSGLYISGFAGATSCQDSSFDGVSNPEPGVPGPTGVAGVPLDVNLDIGRGLAFGGAIGHRFGFKYLSVFHPRIEVEVSRQRRTVDAGSFNGGNQTFGGDQDATFVFINNYSDIVLSEGQRFVPYVGGGLGVAFVNSGVGYFPASATAPTFGVSGKSTAFAMHGALGVSFRVSDPFEFYAEGRYFRILNARFDRRFIGGGADRLVGEVEDDIDGLTGLAGVRWRF